MRFIMGIAAALLFVACADKDNSKAPAISRENAAPAPPPAAPPCIHERCEQRPERLICEGSGSYCYSYRIVYAHHCECDQWAPASPNGERQ